MGVLSKILSQQESLKDNGPKRLVGLLIFSFHHKNCSVLSGIDNLSFSCKVLEVKKFFWQSCAEKLIFALALAYIIGSVVKNSFVLSKKSL